MSDRILIIDDNESMRTSLQMVLETEGFAVAAAADGFQALELARDEHFDIIICDVRMPGIDGLDTIKRIKESQPGARNIVITAVSEMLHVCFVCKQKSCDGQQCWPTNQSRCYACRIAIITFLHKVRANPGFKFFKFF